MRAVVMKPWRSRCNSSATSAVRAASARRIAIECAIGSMQTDTVRSAVVCIKSGVRKAGPTSVRGQLAIQ